MDNNEENHDGGRGEGVWLHLLDLFLAVVAEYFTVLWSVTHPQKLFEEIKQQAYQDIATLAHNAGFADANGKFLAFYFSSLSFYLSYFSVSLSFFSPVFPLSRDSFSFGSYLNFSLI